MSKDPRSGFQPLGKIASLLASDSTPYSAIDNANTLALSFLLPFKNKVQTPYQPWFFVIIVEIISNNKLVL